MIAPISTASLFAQAEGPVSFGFSVMFGGRYDDLRMCVATPAGVKGGMMADIAFNTRFNITDTFAINVTLPVMRPILFALAFQMVQFEPVVTFELRHFFQDDLALVGGFGLGASLHYGPDFRSDLENRGESFFAMGPYISGLFGVGLPGFAGKETILGARAFYVPLFSEDRDPGTVLGGALEAQMFF